MSALRQEWISVRRRHASGYVIVYLKVKR